MNVVPILTDTQRAQFRQLEESSMLLDGFISSLGSSREVSIARTALQEVVKWASKAITK